MDDPGKLVMAGYTAGSRGGKTGTTSPGDARKTLFNWARNITDTSLESDEISRLNTELSTIFALLWHNIKSCPSDQLRIVVKDIENWIEECGIFRMDARKAEDLDHPVVANVDVRVGDQTFTIKNIELAPPCAVVAMNYSRYVLQMLYFT
jgi:hypothetical protein